MATNVASISSLPKFVDLSEYSWVHNPKKFQETARELYMVDTIPYGNGNSFQVEEIDGPSYAKEKAELEDAENGALAMGYNKTLYAVDYSLVMVFSKQWFKYGKYRQIKAQLESMSNLLPNRRDLDLAHRITFAASTSYTNMDGRSVTTTMGDGLALASSVHTLTESSTTYSSIVTGNPRLSTSSLIAALQQAWTQNYDNFGTPYPATDFNWNILWTFRDANTIFTAKQIMNSIADVDSNNSGVMNVMKGMFRHVIIEQGATDLNGSYDSTKAKYWGLCAQGKWEAHGKIFDPDHMEGAVEDPINQSYKRVVAGGWGIEILSARGFMFSAAT